ncbi:unnamed protein product [Gongylonema pulchrum]|uniref:ZP domain-containing protein n=1 Tax=Gongylonema pulchrum TaxID=637853 RepID=A0A183DVX4_9BILA|nr:unnamed protein product [Gongylonema pulchrum]
MSDKCHLDYTRNPLYEPFLFHVPYRSGCNVKREKQSDPPGINYHVVIIVQHHYLFLTEADKAYSVNCFYRGNYENVVQDMEVSGLSPTKLSNSEVVPDCVYEVLKNSVAGEPKNTVCSFIPVLFVILVASRLRSSMNGVPAFKFAEQLVVHFQCKITLCTKEENGCEGITPPACKLITNPNVDTITGDDDGGKAPGISYGEEPSENDSGGGDGAPAPQPSAPPADEQLQYEVTQEGMSMQNAL